MGTKRGRASRSERETRPVLDWLTREPLRKADFFETREGNSRICTPLVVKLCETADIWRKLVAPVAEYVASELWRSVQSRISRSGRLLASRLTGAHRRAAKGSDVPAITIPKVAEHVCIGCGKKIRSYRKLCLKCSGPVTRQNFDAGRKTAQSKESLARRSVTQREHRQKITAWKPSDSDISRETYVNIVLPALVHVTPTQIRSALGVSEPYSMWIKSGKRIPHPRHWTALARLVGEAS